MNKKIVYLLTAVLIIVSLSSCKTLFTREGNLYSKSKAMVRQNNYGQADDNLARALNIDPEYKKAILYLEEIYPEGLNYYRNEIKRYKNEDTLTVLDYRVSIYHGLTIMAEALGTLPTLIHPKSETRIIFEVHDYSEELQSAVGAAAEGYYQEGIRLYASGGREESKAASKAFMKALDYIPGYKDAEKQEAAAREVGMQSILFLPFRGDNYLYRGLDANEMLLDEIVSRVLSDPEVVKYTRIVDRSILDYVLREQKLYSSGLFDESSSIEIGKLLEANIVFSGTNSQTSYKVPDTTVKTANREKEVTPTAEELGREPEEGEVITVEADLYYHEKSSDARLITSYKLIDIETGAVLLSDTLRTDQSDSVSWLTYEGDERVLTLNEIYLLENNDRDVRDVDELIVECVKEMGNKIADQLKSYLR